MSIKKTAVIFIFVILFLSGCNNHTVKTNGLEVSDNNSQTSTNDTSGESSAQKEDAGSDNTPIAMEDSGQDLEYQNKAYGYSLSFPESWRGHFTITTSDSRMIFVNFIGESALSKGDSGDGIFMFCIVSDDGIDDYLDSVKEIGTASGHKLYYATGTDYPLGSLDLSTGYSGSESITDQKERVQIQSEYEKATEMLKDITEILSTFKPIE